MLRKISLTVSMLVVFTVVVSSTAFADGGALTGALVDLGVGVLGDAVGPIFQAGGQALGNVATAGGERLAREIRGRDSVTIGSSLKVQMYTKTGNNEAWVMGNIKVGDVTLQNLRVGSTLDIRNNVRTENNTAGGGSITVGNVGLANTNINGSSNIRNDVKTGKNRAMVGSSVSVGNFSAQ